MEIEFEKKECDNCGEILGYMKCVTFTVNQTKLCIKCYHNRHQAEEHHDYLGEQAREDQREYEHSEQYQRDNQF